jgi:hypothetical protein
MEDIVMQLEPDRFEVTPKDMTRTIEQFCAKTLKAGHPRYLSVQPTRYTASEYCHQAVAAQMQQEGGAGRFGWIIREQPGMYLTADSYAVWASADGNIVDVTPSRTGESRILFADSPALDFTDRPTTHYLRTYRPKTYGDYALAMIERGGGGQHSSSDNGQPRIEDRTAQDHQNDPLAIAIDSFITASICPNALLAATTNGAVCKDPDAYDLASRTRSESRKDMMRLWGHSLIRKADAHFLFEGAV